MLIDHNQPIKELPATPPVLPWFLPHEPPSLPLLATPTRMRACVTVGFLRIGRPPSSRARVCYLEVLGGRSPLLSGSSGLLARVRMQACVTLVFLGVGELLQEGEPGAPWNY